MILLKAAHYTKSLKRNKGDIWAWTVVTKDVDAYALMAGVQARRAGWMSRHGIRLPKPDLKGIMICPESGYRYREVEAGIVKCFDLDEQSPLPPEKSVGKKFYDEFKKKD